MYPNVGEFGGARRNGYGAMKINKKMIGTHRLSFEIFRGDIPDDLFVCHHCDNRCCVNPDHLFLGTQSDNMIDCKNKNRLVVLDGIKYEKGNVASNRSITEDKVKEIRKDIEELYSTITLVEIAKKHKVPDQLLRDIRRKKNDRCYFNIK